ncbi:hypothetical protein GTU99_22435 [Streptomyces sp. PRKS01-65]|nr:hypothetical protein [Streptomyces harenosi]NEY34917.1 hypothetical protein [Streptomyces harenosi]
MSGRRVFLLAFFVTGVLVAGLVAVLAPQEPRGTASPATSPGSVPPAEPGGAADGRSRGTGKPILGVSWSSIWSATVPKGEAVPGRVLGTGRCAALHRWATARAAVPRGTAAVAFTLAAPEDRGLVVRSLRVVEGRAIAVPRGRDVECVGADDRTVARGLGLWGKLSLDAPRDLGLSRYARPGATVGGVVETRTTGCSCEWWIEVEVLEGDAPRTVRIDDGGRPFTIAPPVARIGTDAQDATQQYGAADIALARGSVALARGAAAPARGTAATARDAAAPARIPRGSSAHAVRLLEGGAQTVWMAADREVPAVDRITGNLDVPGTVCGRVERVLMAAGARRAGYTTYGLVLADRSPPGPEEAVADVSLRVQKVERPRTEPAQYDCYGGGRSEWQRDTRERTYVELPPDVPDLPVFTAEPLRFHEDRAGAPGTDVLYFGVSPMGPGHLTYHFTIEVTVRTPSGEFTRYTLDDAGRPFVLATRPDGVSPSDGEHTYREIGQRFG